jgi:hypothetical protein
MAADGWAEDDNNEEGIGARAAAAARGTLPVARAGMATTDDGDE